MAEFDLTTRMGQYLDRHLVFPLLEFLSVKEVTIAFITWKMFEYMPVDVNDIEIKLPV